VSGSSTGGSGCAGSERLALTGFMAAGKSTVGPLVARRRGCPFLDLDDVVERMTGKTPARILEEQGEDTFRRLEVEALASLVGEPAWVLALGGGTVTSAAARRLLAEAGVWVVWLAVDFETVRGRLDPAQRPLWGTDEAANRKLFDRRTALYLEAAHVVVDGRGDPEAVAARVLSAVRERCVG
jgi:shikimate kinase